MLADFEKDDRPFPVGYREFPATQLPARDGVPHGGVRRSARAPNCSFFTNWTAPDDRITWDVEVATAGRYEVEVLLHLPGRDVGSTVELSFGDSEACRRRWPRRTTRRCAGRSTTACRGAASRT